MRTGRLWIDLTDLARWHGHPTGIQRVALNLAQRYRGRSEVSFLVFDHLTRRFWQVDPGFLEESEPIDGPLEPQEASASNLRAKLSAKQSLGSVARGLEARSPNVAGPCVEKARWVLGRTRREVEQRRFMARIRISAPDFLSGDDVLLLGASWMSGRLLGSLASLKASERIRIYHLIYDLIPARLPHMFEPEFADAFTAHMTQVVKLFDGLMAISQSTKRDIEAFCMDLVVPVPPVDVFRLGDDLGTGTSPHRPDCPVSERGFVLSVGTIEIRKNYQLLYQAWRLAGEEERALPPLVVVGRPGWLSGDILHVLKNDPSIRGRVFILGGVTDAELTWLYDNCLFTVYPSLYEGWGLPIAESLGRGRVCLSSGTSSMPEIAGDLVDYFSPFDPRGCLDLMLTYLDRRTREAREDRISASYRRRSWNDSHIDFDEAFGRLRSLRA
ncbi:MAG: glycosyltransferase [Thermoleophilia bacterium]